MLQAFFSIISRFFLHDSIHCLVSKQNSSIKLKFFIQHSSLSPSSSASRYILHRSFVSYLIMHYFIFHSASHSPLSPSFIFRRRRRPFLPALDQLGHNFSVKKLFPDTQNQLHCNTVLTEMRELTATPTRCRFPRPSAYTPDDVSKMSEE